MGKYIQKNCVWRFDKRSAAKVVVDQDNVAIEEDDMMTMRTESIAPAKIEKYHFALDGDTTFVKWKVHKFLVELLGDKVALTVSKDSQDVEGGGRQVG